MAAAKTVDKQGARARVRMAGKQGACVRVRRGWPARCACVRVHRGWPAGRACVLVRVAGEKGARAFRCGVASSPIAVGDGDLERAEARSDARGDRHAEATGE
eukprot:6016000-Prymnesium_polylepis.1